MADLPGCPAPLLDVLATRSAEVIRLTDHAPRYHVRLRTPDGPLFAWYSAAGDDEGALEHELAIRQAIGTDGLLRCPPVLAAGRSWRVERMIEPEPLQGADTIARVVAAWAELTEMDLPRRRGGADAPAAGARARRWLRLARSRLPLADVVRARRLAANSTLPRVTSHGDFHAAHVLPRDGAVWLIDWELSGRAPLGLDPMQLWASLDDDEAREELLQCTLEAVPAQHHRGVLELRYVALVRRIGSKVAELPRFGDRDLAAADRLLRLLPTARAAITD